MSLAPIIVGIVVIIAIVYTVRHIRGLFKGTSSCCGGGGCSGCCSSCHTESTTHQSISSMTANTPKKTQK